MKVINIGGPINSGKTTTSKILAASLPNSIFIEVDDLTPDEEKGDGHGWMENLRRFYIALDKHVQENKYDYVMFAYPMYPETHDRITEIIKDKAELVIVTLNPSMDKCLTNRGTRELNEWEMGRIKEMYNEGVSSFHKSDLIIDNTNQTPGETAEVIMDYIKG